MSVGGFTPLEVEEFGGLYSNIVTALDAPVYQGSAKGKIRTSALEAKNLRFIPGGFLGRDGLTTAFDFGGTRKATHIAQLITQQDQRQILVVADDGGLYREPAAGQTLVALKTDWAPATAIGHSATLFDREHLAVSDGRVGVGSPVVWDRTNLDRMSPSGPGKSHTLAAGAAGLVTNGEHEVVVIFETRHGYRPAPSLFVPITVAGNTKIVVSNIPTGPSWVVRRIVAMTAAGGSKYFFVSASSAGMIIDDNTTTTTTIDVADAVLTGGGLLVDNLFRRIGLSERAGMLSYGTRMVTWGGRTRIQLPNLDFDGGFDPATPALPAGWIAGGSFSGGIRESADTYFGEAFRISGAGNASDRGSMTLPIDAETARINFEIGKKYVIRYRAKKNILLTSTGFLEVELIGAGGALNTSFLTLTDTWTVYEGTVGPITALPTSVRVRANPIQDFAIGRSVSIDDIQLYSDELHSESSVLRVSDESNPEAYDGVKGLVQVSPDDGQKVVTAFNFRDLLFICKERSLYVTRDDGVNPPSLWPVQFVDNIGCDSLHGATVAGEQFAIISYRAGVYAIFGLRPVKINQEIQQSPAGFVSWDDREEPQAYKNHVMIDAELKNIYLSVVRSGGTWPNRTFVLNYWKGWGEQERKWSHDDWNLPSFTPNDIVTASALIEESSKQSLFFGSEELNLYRHAGLNDDSRVIEHSYRGAYAGFQGSYGDNLFGALSIHGLTSGSNLIIEALLMDETLNTLSQAGGETLTAAKYLELQTNLTALKLSYRLRSNTLDSTIRVDSMTTWGRVWAKVGIM